MLSHSGSEGAFFTVGNKVVSGKNYSFVYHTCLKVDMAIVVAIREKQLKAVRKDDPKHKIEVDTIFYEKVIMS